MNKSTAPQADNAELADLLAAGTRVIEDEVICIDEQRWDQWLALFTEDCVYWAPTWVNDSTLADDPATQMSHIYYENRAALEDRVLRFTSRISPASNPRPRTTHLLGNIRLREGTSEDRVCLRASWVSHVFFPYQNRVHTLFGSVEHDLVRQKGDWLIARKKIILQNDYIPTMLDIYCL